MIIKGVIIYFVENFCKALKLESTEQSFFSFKKWPYTLTEFFKVSERSCESTNLFSDILHNLHKGDTHKTQYGEKILNLNEKKRIRALKEEKTEDVTI